MKKVLSIFLAAILSCSLLAACSSGTGASSIPGSKNLTIVTTTFPIYDWTMNILGDNPAGIKTILLQDDGTDLHGYQPSSSDIMSISNSDLFIYTGGKSDEWVTNISSHYAINGLSLIQALGERDAETDSETDQEPDPEPDEHVWLSLKNASVLVGRIASEIVYLDPDNGDYYLANAAALAKTFDLLDSEYETAVANARTRVLVFGGRFPFRCLADDYGLECYAAFDGCSAETEADSDVISTLAKKIDEESLGYILAVEGRDNKIAEAVVENTRNKDQEILALEAMETVTRKDVKQGASYLQIMQDNLGVMKMAIGCEKDM